MFCRGPAQEFLDLDDAEARNGEHADADAEVFIGPESEEMLTFENSARVPGIEHVVQNCLQASCSKLPEFDAWLTMAVQVGKFFHGGYYMDMMEATNFSSNDAAWILKKLKMTTVEWRIGLSIRDFCFCFCLHVNVMY